MEQISIIIPTFNRIKCLKETVNSFLCGEIKPNEIIVVDQSTDEIFRKQIKEFCGSIDSVKYVFSNTPSGARARNIGIKIAKNDVIVFSDDDVIVGKDILLLVQEVMSNKDISLIAGLDINSKPQGKLGYLFGTKSYRKKDIGHVTASVLGRYPDKVNKITKTEWAMGFFFVVRKSLIDKTNNYFDNNFISYSYAEDLDFTYRYIRDCNVLGYKAIIHPKIIVNHIGSKEYRIPSEKTDMMYVVNRYYIACKNNMGFKSNIAMRWTNFGMVLFRIIKHQNYKSLLNSIRYLNKNKKEIREGILGK